MADLPNGSTIGGERIIHKGIANKHRHHASQIDGLNPLFYGDVGDGGGIDADVLSGKTYNDLTQEFLQVRNDSISSLTLSNHPVLNQHAASLLYLKNSIPNSLQSGNFFGITSIGSPTEESYNYFVGPYNINLSSMKVLINGAKHLVPARFIDIRTITPDYQNTSFHFYIQVSNGSAQFIAQESKVQNNNTLIYIGSAYTNGSGIISQYIPIKNEEKIGIGSLMLSKTPKSNAIPVSLESGKVDSGWVFGAKGETIVNLSGQNTVYPRETATYKISNFNSFSMYSATIDTESQSQGIYIDSFEDDTLTLYTGDISPSASTIELIINRDGGDNSFPITLMADAPASISGPSEVQSGGLNYQFTINNYIEEYTYNVSTTNGTVQRNGNIITYISPVGLENDVQSSITVSREGSSDTINFNIIAIPPFELVGDDEIYGGWYFDYTITPYDPQVSYTVETTPVTDYTVSGDTITLETPNNVSSDYNVNLKVISSIGTSSKSIMVNSVSPLFNITSVNTTLTEYGSNNPVTYYKDVNPKFTSYSVDHIHNRLNLGEYDIALGAEAFYIPLSEYISNIVRVGISIKGGYDFEVSIATFHYLFPELNSIQTFTSGGGHYNMRRNVVHIRGMSQTLFLSYERDSTSYLLRNVTSSMIEDALSSSIPPGRVQCIYDAYEVSANTYAVTYSPRADFLETSPIQIIRGINQFSYNYVNGITAIGGSRTTFGSDFYQDNLGYYISYNYMFDLNYIASENCYLGMWIAPRIINHDGGVQEIYIEPYIAFVKLSQDLYTIIDKHEVEIPSKYLTDNKLVLSVSTSAMTSEDFYSYDLLSHGNGHNLTKSLVMDNYKQYCTFLNNLFIYHDYDNNITRIGSPDDNDIYSVVPEMNGNVLAVDSYGTKITYIKLPEFTMETTTPELTNINGGVDYSTVINPNPRTAYFAGMTFKAIGSIDTYLGTY